jgi:predicted O-methyltransferase YrrM
MDYDLIDRQLADGSLRFDRSLAQSYEAGCLGHPAAERLAQIKNLSMLGLQTLLMLRAFALEARGGIVEAGPYVGGSTVAILEGVAASAPKPVVSIDPGGQYLEHPSMPSSDIHADWAANVAGAGYEGKAYLAKGFANVASVGAEAVAALGGAPIGMLFIDANGDIWKNMQHVLPYMTDDCLIVLDDYTNLTVPEDQADNIKFNPTQQSVKAGLAAGALEEYGIFLWGTWFGRRGPNLAGAFPRLLADEIARNG